MALGAPSQMIETLSERKYLRGLLGMLPSKDPVVLVGSWARGAAASEWSDIDILVVSDVRPSLPPPRIHVIVIPRAEFERRLLEGDDFPQWALRFGVPLAGRRAWARLRSRLLQAAPWPGSYRKIHQAMRKLRTAEDLLHMGDSDAAEEEIRFGLSHIARAELLSHNVFPLSRPELAQQLKGIGDSALAQMMNRANDASPMNEAEIKEALELLRNRVGAGNLRDP